MSKENETNETVREERTSPLWRNLALWIGFVLLLVAAVFTVVLPELEDDPQDGDETSVQADEADEEPTE